MAEFIKVDALGDACPLPVVKAKKAISELQGAGQVEVLVDHSEQNSGRDQPQIPRPCRYGRDRLQLSRPSA